MRTPIEAEVYWLKFVQLLLPIHGYRIPLIADILNKYNSATSVIVNENSIASLVAIGSICLILLTGWLFACKFEAVKSIVNDRHRMLAVFLPLFYDRLAATTDTKAFFCVAIGVLLIVGVADQTSLVFVLPYDRIKSAYVSDDHFIRQIEVVMSANTTIYQMPYMQFPGGRSINSLENYPIFRGYLHSDSLRWGYGTMAGRPGAIWGESVADKSPEELLKTLSFAGFKWICVAADRYTPESYSRLSADLTTLLNVSSVFSDNGKFSFYDISGYNDRLKANYSADEWARQEKVALKP